MGLAQERRVGHHGSVRTRTGTTTPTPGGNHGFSHHRKARHYRRHRRSGLRRSKVFEAGWKVATGRPIPAEDSDDVTIASLVLFAATSAAIAAVAQRYAYKGSQKWLAPKLEARFGVPQLEA